MPNQEFQFEDYEIEESLGTCSGGTLYRAYRPAENAGRGRRDLVYRAFPEIARDPNLVHAVGEQLERSAGVNHANLFASVRSAHSAGELILVSDWSPGVRLSTLNTRISDSGARWSVPAALHLVGELAKALCHLHSRFDQRKGLSLVHGCVSPENVFITFDGQVKLLSLGMAAVEGYVLGARNGHQDGLANYASPEQAAGRDIDGRSDLFSLGVLLWGLIAARPLFPPCTRDEWMRVLGEKTPPPPTQANPEAPPELDSVAAKLLDRDFHLRYELGERAAQDIFAVLKFRFPEFAAADFVSFCARHAAPFRESYQAFLDSRDESRQQTRTKNYDPAAEPAPTSTSFANPSPSAVTVEKPAEGFRVSLTPVAGPRPTMIDNSVSIFQNNWLKPALAICAAVLLVSPVAGPRVFRHYRERRLLAQKAKADQQGPHGSLHLVTKETSYDLEINGKPVVVDEGYANVPANRELLVKVSKFGYEDIETVTQVLPDEDLDLPLEFRKLASTDDGDTPSPAPKSKAKASKAEED